MSSEGARTKLRRVFGAGKSGPDHHSFGKHRAEALSDGVFAIAMTLLVLDLKVPTGFAPGQLAAALREGGPTWYSFVLTFVIAAMFWTLQHRVFDLLDRMSKLNLRLTLATLGLVTVLPFSTSLLGHAHGDPLAFELYFGNQSAIALSLVLQLEVARAQGELRTDSPALHIRLRLWSITLVMLSAVVAAHFMPLKQLWAVPIGIGAIMRVFRLRARMRAAASS